MDSKDKILNAALKLFIKEGFHGTSTSKIAKEAGVSNGTLFHHFKTKESLISRLYIRIKEDYRDYLLKHVTSCKTSKDKVKQCWFGFVRWALENKDSMTFFMMFSNSPYIDKLSKEEACRNFNFIFEIIQEAIDDETLINVHPSLIMNSMYGSVLGFLNFVNENPGKLDESIDVAFKMCWRSIVNI
ncbi:TetR/AcrR family transcriptional regulator [Anaeromicrobium sediminis]|uniref:HTH tetR-type domain-containing protein n=1 Tax=Anaeromicrobium sediminis TaxID=1478221 RepID=A0A267MJI8_9FIRM|nr:TetR/AcrR family transcriptional regulator [Anaeromicrobium sediminis]PAB59078.1 hypothetical protein CCE28_11200 [Anaeromicrobium sediminis]